MTILGVLRPTVAVGLLLGLAACSGSGGGTAAPAPGSPAASSASLTDRADAPVLLIEHTGGYVPVQHSVGRLPLAAMYADGRVITQGPVPAIFPGPALPNLQVRRVDAQAVQLLVDRALAAGVGESADLGTPGITDVPSTRFTLVTDSGTHVREVYALSETTMSPPEPGAQPWSSGLTPEQEAARAELRGLVDALNDLDATVGPDAATPSASYVPEVVTGVVTPWIEPDEQFRQPAQPWPGPPLPGEPLDADLGVSCVAARNEAAQSVLTAARSATASTPWVSADGTRWSVLLRPLLPGETGCADLTD